MYASEHTKLMNKFIGLCSSAGGWPSILYEQGYRICLIEQRISTESASVTPDVVVMSNKLSHAIVADCKGGGNVDSGQDSRYESIKPKHLFMWVHVREKERFGCTACYVTNDAIYDQLRTHTTLPFIVFDGGRVEGKGDFGADALNRALNRGASLAGMYEPTNFYPFSHDDNEELIVKHVITGLLAWLNKNRPKSLDSLVDDEVATAILKIVHPQYKHMGERYQNMLRSKVKKIFASLVSRKEFKAIKDKRVDGQLTAPVLQRFKEQCQSIVKNRMVQVTLD